MELFCLTRDTSSKVFSRIQLNRNSKDLLKWPWKIRCLNQRDESAFDVDQLESVGKKKEKPLAGKKQANEETWKTPNSPHQQMSHARQSMFSKRAFAANASFLPRRSTLQWILTILRTLGRGGPTGAPRKKFQTRTFLVLRPRVNFHFQKWRRERERKTERSSSRVSTSSYMYTKVALKRNSSVIQSFIKNQPWWKKPPKIL